MPSDPSLTALTPRPTRGRSLLLVVIAIVLLVGAWFSPDVLRPGPDVGAGSAGAWAAIPQDEVVLRTVDISMIAPIGGTVVGIGDVPGATVVDAWLFQPPVETPALDSQTLAQQTVDDVLADAYAPGVLDGAALPQRIASGPVQVVVLWKITDCGALDEWARPSMTVTNVLGMSFERPFPDFTGPALSQGVGSLAEGICPAPAG
ncbi:hypothetical protein DLJ96_11380 [Actinotalea fermentans ATCC 43279 = JCM 9966 = DSM 3133]|nr:hypothetical protein DLJ96_11380 [Actinotalea fermentans ATCC 43279 = JCM 9966 = DSM 3133]